MEDDIENDIDEIEVTCSICGLKYWTPEWMHLQDLAFTDEPVCPGCRGEYQVP